MKQRKICNVHPRSPRVPPVSSPRIKHPPQLLLLAGLRSRSLNASAPPFPDEGPSVAPAQTMIITLVETGGARVLPEPPRPRPTPPRALFQGGRAARRCRHCRHCRRCRRCCRAVLGLRSAHADPIWTSELFRPRVVHGGRIKHTHATPHCSWATREGRAREGRGAGRGGGRNRGRTTGRNAGLGFRGPGGPRPTDKSRAGACGARITPHTRARCALNCYDYFCAPRSVGLCGRLLRAIRIVGRGKNGINLPGDALPHELDQGQR